MIPIQLKYKRSILAIDFPTDWNELSHKQLLYIAKNWEAWKEAAKNNISLIRAKCALFLQLAPAFNYQKQKKYLNKIEEENLFELTQLTNFVFEKNTLTKCPIPHISNLTSRNLYAPSDKLGGITGFDFVFADDCYLKYLAAENSAEKISNIETLIGTLYRPRKFFSTERVAFNNNQIQNYAAIASKLSYPEKQLILLWYIACRDHIVKNNQDVFSSANAAEAKSSGWLQIILALAGNKFGTFEQTGHTAFHLILMEIREAKDRKPKPKTA